jgi:2-oxoglutarate dehydrogenase E2 component (dihydrolipoamide succinyltransferase)
MSIEILMPSLGESVSEGTINKWLIKEGDFVTNGQKLAVIVSDKADVEIYAPADGRIEKIYGQENQTLNTGTKLIDLDETAKGSSPMSPPRPTLDHEIQGQNQASGAAPSVRKLAIENDIDLSKVQGTGERGRITQEDVRQAMQTMSQPPMATHLAAHQLAPPPAVPTGTGTPPPATTSNHGTADWPVPNVGYGTFKVPRYNEKPGDSLIPFSRKRQITADHMTYSKIVSPHVVTVAEVDLNRVSKLRDEYKDAYKKEGLSLSVLAFVCVATTRALRMYSGLNARIVDKAVAQIRAINLGIAVDAPDGLVVPNLKNADELSLRGMCRAIADVAGRARSGKLTADDFSGSTFTVSNPGIKGNLFGGAIISQPNVGILRMGEIKKRVVVVEGEGGDQMAIHPMMYMALSYDHRVVDGVLGNSFLWTVSDLLNRGEFEP